MHKESQPSVWKAYTIISTLVLLIVLSVWTLQPPAYKEKSTYGLNQNKAGHSSILVDKKAKRLHDKSSQVSKESIDTHSSTHTIDLVHTKSTSKAPTFQAQDLDIPENRSLWVKRTRSYQVPVAVRSGESFTFKPFEDVELAVNPLSTPPLFKTKGNFYQGTLQDQAGDTIGRMEITWVVASGESESYGYFGRFILDDGQSFELHHHPDGQVSVSEVDYQKLPFIEPEVPQAPDVDSNQILAQHDHTSDKDHEGTHFTDSETQSPMIASDEAVESAENANHAQIAQDNQEPPAPLNNLTTLTALVVGSQRAVNSSGGQSAFDARVANAINIANQAYVNSQVNMELVVVHQEIINNPRQSGLDVLSKLANKFDNFFDNIPAIRSQKLADIVIMIDEVSDRNRICGIGYLGPTNYYAYSVTDWQCTANHTVTHEIGHNMGSHHDENNAPGGLQPAYGHRFGAYRTIMSYAPGVRSSYLSNPNVVAFNLPTGTDRHNNALVHNNNSANMAANFGGVLTLSGEVLTRDGHALAEVAVNGPTGVQNTTNQGSFSFVGLSEGLGYTLTASKPDYSFTPKSIQGTLDQNRFEIFTGSLTPQLQIADVINLDKAQQYTIDVPAVDHDDETLTFSVTSTPAVNLTLQTQAKAVQVSFTLPDQIAAITLHIEATDGIGTDSKEVRISLENQAPTLNVASTHTITHNQVNPQINLGAQDANNDPLTYTVTATDQSAIARQLMQSNTLVYLGTDDNAYGLNERVFRQGSRRIILLDDGRLLRWRGRLSRSTLIDTISPIFHELPELLFSESHVAANVQAEVVNGSLVFSKALAFTGVLRFEVSVSDGSLSTSQTIEVLIANLAPEIEPLADMNVHAGPGVHTIAVQMNDPDQDPLSVSVSVKSASMRAYELDQELNLVYQSRYFNRLRLQEHRFTSGRSIYILLPDGRLLEWDRRLRANSPVIAYLNESIYETPTLLSDAEEVLTAEVTASIQNNQLSIDPQDHFVGQVEITIHVTDQVSTVSESFNFTTQNQAPFIAPIDDQSMHFNANTHTVALHVSDADHDLITLSAESSSEEQIAFDLQQSYAFTYNSRFDNRLRLNEKRLQVGRDLYILLPDGRLLAWDRRLRSQSPAIAQLSSIYYDDPNLLINATQPTGDPLVLSVENNTLLITRNGPFLGRSVITVHADDGFSHHTETFTLSSNNQAPILAEIADQSRHVTSDHVSIQLQAEDFDGDSLSFTTNVQSTQELAYQLDQELNFVYQSRYFNRLRLQEHRFTSGRIIYILLPDGRLLKWSRSLRADSPMIAQLPSFYYENPSLLEDVALPDDLGIQAQIDPNTQLLSIHYPIITSESLLIDVTVDDGKGQITQSFSLHTTNTDPTISSSDHVHVHAGNTTYTIPFNANDTDGDTLTFSAQVQTMQKLAFDLDQIHDFRVDERRFNGLRLQEHRLVSGRVIFILLPDGRLLQWNRRAGINSPLVAQFSLDFYDDPSLLVDVELPLENSIQVEVQNQELLVTAHADFIGTAQITVSAEDFLSKVDHTLFYTTENEVPQIHAPAQITMSGQTLSRVIEVNDPDGDEVQVQISVASESSLIVAARELYDLNFRHRFNRQRLQEYLFNSNEGVLMLLPDGRLLKWNSRLRENSPVLTYLPPLAYNNPQAIAQMQAVDTSISASYQQGVLEIQRFASNESRVGITIEASDAWDTVSHTLIVTLEAPNNNVSSDLSEILVMHGNQDFATWTIDDPSRIIDRGHDLMFAITGKEQTEEYPCGLETWVLGMNDILWQPEHCLLQVKPEWIEREIPDHDGAYWAPSFLNQHTMYYSVSSGSDATVDRSCIGVLHAQTVDGVHQWVDSGEAVLCTENAEDSNEDKPNSIDPAAFIDDDGRAYLLYGGGHIYMIEINPHTGLLMHDEPWSVDNEHYIHLAEGSLMNEEGETVNEPAWIEAPYLLKHDGYYYLFVNWFACCAGSDSTYEVRVGRSETIDGPYLDQDDLPMLQGGGTLFHESNDTQIGPGHVGVLYKELNGLPSYLMSYHYYTASGSPWATLGTRLLVWEDQWPILEDEDFNLLEAER